MEKKNDPLGQAILDFAKTKKSKKIIVSSDLCDDDYIDSAYLFRSYDQMPDLEKIALQQCVGTVLDIGAGAGAHAKYLIEKGLDVTALELSKGACSYLKEAEIPFVQTRIQDYQGTQYDTLLLLMNGIGLAGSLEKLEQFLQHLKKLLKPGGKILCDSTDIMYLYEDEDGYLWVDLNSEYYGNFRFQMSYGKHQTEWFDWLYVDFDRLQEIAEKVGFTTQLLYESEDQYLVELTINE
jgi:cyclopropane fatty-acyl-phospholipid synthase-like methyltransferase